jgi:MFS superfamily sulfate permease-like transporter
VAAIVFLIGVELVDIPGMRRALEARPREFWIALFTAAVVVVVGVEQAIVVAIALSLISHTRRGYSPNNSVLVRRRPASGTQFPSSKAARRRPDWLSTASRSLYYANVQKLQDEVLELTRPAAVSTRWLCVDGVAMDDVDFTGGATLVSIANTLRQRNARLVFASVSGHVREELDRSGVTELVGTDAYFGDLEQARREFEHGTAPDRTASAADRHD